MKGSSINLFNAVIWTIAAVIAVLNTLHLNPIGIILFTVNAVIWWVNYAKKRKEANHEEKESS